MHTQRSSAARFLSILCLAILSLPSIRTAGQIVPIRPGPFPDQPPKVALISPREGDVFAQPANIRLVANAHDGDGSVRTVEFFAGDRSLGIVTNRHVAFYPIELEADLTQERDLWIGFPFMLLWAGVPAGAYSLSAVATDDSGASSKSESVLIKVVTNSRPTLVSVVARDPEAHESDERLVKPQANTGTFVIERSGPTNIALQVFYRLTGTASNGVDYKELPQTVTIPVGARVVEVVVDPIDDKLPEGTEDVVLSILPPVCLPIMPPPPGCYAVDNSDRARVTIRDDESPIQLLSVVATVPQTREMHPRMAAPLVPAVFTISRTGPVTEELAVYYRVGGTARNGVDYEELPGKVTIAAGESSVPLYVVAIDDELCEGTESVTVAVYTPCLTAFGDPSRCYFLREPFEARVVILDNDLCLPNIPPRVAIVRPEEESSFRAGADIPITVEVRDPDGWVPHVAFFAHNRKIGEQVLNYLVEPPPGQLQVFSMIWSNVSAGRYALTARATDDQGLANTSSPVHITVGQSNRLPVVTLMTTDAFANEEGNTATFRVQRVGGSEQSLTVYYSIAGTARNGVDYQRLSGATIIPAGARGAHIEVLPLRDRLREPIETVVLQLSRSSISNAPTYEIGGRDIAAAVIVDFGQPRPPCHRLEDGRFYVCIPAPDGFAYRLEASTDLIDWEMREWNSVEDGAVHYVDPYPKSDEILFYRAVPALDLDSLE